MSSLIPSSNTFRKAYAYCYMEYKKFQEAKQEFKHEPHKIIGYVIKGTYWPLFPFRLVGVKMITIHKITQIFIKSKL